MLIRDPVHGDITLSRLEAAVLDCAAVQRLRGIKQLGTAYLVYPGAVHTRFDHSLGASAVAHRIVAALRREGVEVARELDDLIGVGALLHDVTHVPYGHTLEDERRLFPRHDKGSRLAQLLEGELGSALSRLGIRDAVADLLGAGGAALPGGRVTSSRARSMPTCSITCAATPTSPAWRTTTTTASSTTSPSPTATSHCG